MFALRDPRPSPRPAGAAGSPLRQWSQGPLDLAGAQGPGMMRDKRRPSAQLVRRESASTVDTGEWGGGSPREPGPNVTKWDQLPLSLELQHAIVKYGIGPPNKIQQRAVPFLLRGSDIIAQAPPTQERIAAYVIPAIQICLNTLSQRLPMRGPTVLIICTTVDQANQGHKMLRDLGGPIGLRVAISTGGGSDVSGDLRQWAQNAPHVICGTPQRMNALFTAPQGGVSGADVRFLVLDEVDQLIARTLHENVFNVVRLLPPARRTNGAGTPAVSPAAPMTPVHNPFDNPFPGNQASPFQPSVNAVNRRFPAILPNPGIDVSPGVERQTALFSNTVPQDVLNLANAIQMREAVRVLVRRDGNGPHQPGEGGGGHSRPGLKNYYLYLAFTAGGRAEPAPQTPGGGLGIIGSGRGATSAETETSRQWKLDALSELLEDVDVPQAIVYVGGINALESVLYRLVGKGFEAIPLHGDMSQGQRMGAFQKFRVSHGQRQGPTKVLVVYDVPIKAPDVYQVPLVINYDLPKAVEEYSPRVAPAMSNNRGAKDGVVVNFVTATGGDVEMLRSIECFYKYDRHHRPRPGC
ncbi:P-loop containing nucleoside triphosphate hydrolase protein [Calocera viscosa TUFC12733]|uniref:RNA helicase n=1 Tax=Calocera viscosa (strain TUFC12733) TaxID=1330018 RepID=A0A167J3G0_CALVF|nr:P-loop containing nucleoside triphosphate hydrolase protein [Calocera viscosa TUFC12733]